MDENSICEKARAALQAGRLPRRRPDRTWGGPGIGALCAICDLPVQRDDMEFEIHFAHDGRYAALDKFHVHAPCFAAWEFELMSADELEPARWP